MQNDVPVEVQMYLQNVRQYLMNNKEAYEYFIGSSPEEDFFDMLEKIAINNFLKNGEPQLTKVQFEVLKFTSSVFDKINEEPSQPEDSIYEYFSKEIKIKLK